MNAVSSSRSSYFLQDSSYSTFDNITQTDTSKSHRINLSYKTNLDSLTSIEIKPSIRFDQANSSRLTENQFLTSEDSTSLANSILNGNDSKGFSSTSEFRIRRKFKKPKRELKAEYVLRTQNNETESILENNSAYYLPNPYNESTLQDKINTNSYINQSSKLTYTEPLTEKFRLQLEYLFQKTDLTKKF